MLHTCCGKVELANITADSGQLTTIFDDNYYYDDDAMHLILFDNEKMFTATFYT